ncbi:MAG: endonuclease domain-containing protein [Clostridia bacterium]|nr:endonuclease domain-containing protein [Clostridia bacterium]
MENDRKRIHNKELVPLAKTLRKGMTKEEKHLWYDFLRNYPINFIRQKIIGNYIADFYCPRASLIVELDGSQHYSEKGKQDDAERDAFLFGYGMSVLHISNYDINTNFDGACIMINKRVREHVGYDPLEIKNSN